jgi:hypothetical protein
VEEEVEKKMEVIKEKYQTELDALLGALKAAKDECLGLKSEMEGLKKVAASEPVEPKVEEAGQVDGEGNQSGGELSLVKMIACNR